MIARPLRRAELEIRPSPIHGFGVFAGRAFLTGELLEECPCVVLAAGGANVDAHLMSYVFVWAQEPEGRAVVFGSGSVFNHSSEPNATWEVDVARRVYVFRAARPIAAGDEILIDYGPGWWSV